MQSEELKELQKKEMRKAVDLFLPEFLCRFLLPQREYSLRYAKQCLEAEIKTAAAQMDARPDLADFPREL